MLTQDDYNTLIEAVEIWKDMMPMEGHQFGDMMTALTSGDSDKLKSVLTNTKEEVGRKRQSRKEQAILLQAKLIQMRDAADLQEVIQSLKTGI